MQDQSWRLYVPGILHRRAVPVQIEFLKNIATKIRRVAISAIARAIVRNEVRDAAQRDCGFETICVPDDPVGHKTAVTSARHPHPFLIDPGITLQGRIDAAHDVDKILAAPFIDDAPLELLTVTGRAARICKQYRVTLRRINLKLVIPIHSILTRRTAVYAENHWILLACSPVDGFDEKAIDVPIVRALIGEAFDVGESQLLPQRFIKICQLAFVLSI